MNDWRRILGGGCLANLVITGLLVGLLAGVASITIDNIAWPFLLGATLSFGSYLFYLRGTDGGGPMRKLVLSVVGVILGSVLVILGIAAYILIAGSISG